MVSDFSNTVYQNTDRQQEDFTQILKKISSTDKIRAIDVEENAGKIAIEVDDDITKPDIHYDGKSNKQPRISYKDGKLTVKSKFHRIVSFVFAAHLEAQLFYDDQDSGGDV